MTDSLIYVGRSLPGGRLQRYTVFKNGLPEHVKRLCAQYQPLRQLIVPSAQLRDAQAELLRTGSRLHTMQRQLFAAFSAKS